MDIYFTFSKTNQLILTEFQLRQCVCQKILAFRLSWYFDGQNKSCTRPLFFAGRNFCIGRNQNYQNYQHMSKMSKITVAYELLIHSGL